MYNMKQQCHDTYNNGTYIYDIICPVHKISYKYLHRTCCFTYYGICVCWCVCVCA